jgi:hypothetical protein
MLSFGNSKLKKDGIASFSLPAGKTCPQAGKCLNGCYALQGFFNMPSVKQAYAKNFEATKSPYFFENMSKELIKSKAKNVRIHASGDFYNKSYFKLWVALALHNPNIQFYAYSKMVLMIKTYKQELLQKGISFPNNLTIIFSEGGKQDSMISPNNDRHSRVFDSLESLKAAGYADTTTHDTGAMGPNHKIGLVYHGAKSKAWVS